MATPSKNKYRTRRRNTKPAPFHLRFPSREFSQLLKQAAKAKGVSLNNFILAQLETSLAAKADSHPRPVAVDRQAAV